MWFSIRWAARHFAILFQQPYGKIITLLEPPCDSDAMMLEKATRLIETNQLQVKVSQILPFTEFAEAHRLVEMGDGMGKIVLNGE